MLLGIKFHAVKPLALLIGLSALLVACVGNSNNSSGTSQYLTVANQKSAAHGLQLSTTIDYSTSTLRDVAKGNGIYVVVGDNGVIITSKDGVTWQTQNGVVTANLSGVTYNPVSKLFYAVGDAGLVISSADGVTWTIYKNLTPSVKLNSIMSVKGDEVIVGESGNVFEVAVTSKRGIITVRGLDSPVNATATSFNGSDMMVIGTAAGGLYYKTYSTFSTNNWTNTKTFTNMPISDISYDPIDSWFTTTTLNGAVIQSSDGKSWSSPVLVDSTGSINLNSIALEPISNNFIVAGSDAAQKPYTSFSSDFNQWNNYSIAAQSQIQKIRCFDNSSCVAVGNNEALSFATKNSDSSGMDWTAISLNQNYYLASLTDVNSGSIRYKKIEICKLSNTDASNCTITDVSAAFINSANSVSVSPAGNLYLYLLGVNGISKCSIIDMAVTNCVNQAAAGSSNNTSGVFSNDGKYFYYTKYTTMPTFNRCQVTSNGDLTNCTVLKSKDYYNDPSQQVALNPQNDRLLANYETNVRSCVIDPSNGVISSCNSAPISINNINGGLNFSLDGTHIYTTQLGVINSCSYDRVNNKVSDCVKTTLEGARFSGIAFTPTMLILGNESYNGNVQKCTTNDSGNIVNCESLAGSTLTNTISLTVFKSK